MNQLYKGKAKYILAWASVLLFMTITLYGRVNSFEPGYFHTNLTCDTVPKRVPEANDTIAKPTPPERRNINPPVPNDALKGDTSIVPVSDTFNFKIGKDSLDAPITYHADDSMILDVPTKKIILYGKESTVHYTDNELKAPVIEFDQRTSIVSAYMVRDSTGKVVSFATYNQGTFQSVSDTLRFNLKNQKGQTISTYFKQDELFVHVDKSKKLKENNQDVIYGLRARFTTCNLDTPHFAFISNKIKFINKKVGFSGPVHPEFEGVPVPVYLPFGIYPLSRGRHSGILSPTFSVDNQYGLALEGLGYYKVINDNWDVVTRGTIYSYGGWTANVSPRYYKRYHYQGNFSLDFQHFRDLDNAGGRNINIRWTHNSDSKARPGVSFAANVNAGSSRFNAAVHNSVTRQVQNQLYSSITYSKIWKDKPFSMTVSANHNQNTLQRLINLNLPDIGFNVNTLYPFRRHEPIGEYKWYENIGIALNSNLKSNTFFYDTAGHIFNQISKNLQYGANHNVPISLSLPEIGHMQVSPGVSYQERWYQQRTRITWNNTTKKQDTVINKGFYAAREMQFSLGVGTRIFGMFGFSKRSKIQAIRHEIRPSLSVSYKPDMNRRSWYTAQVDTFGNTLRYSVYNGNVIASPFGEGKFGGLSFGIDNNLQMKVRSRRDTGDVIKKITILDGLSINGSYNFLQDSFRLTPFSVSARTNLFDKISITASGIIDPYLLNAEGTRMDKLIWSKRPWSLGRLTSGSIAVQSQFQGGTKGKTQTLAAANQQMQQQQNLNNTISGMPLNEYQREAAYLSNNPAEYADFNIPWSVNFSYSLSFYRTGREKAIFSQNVNWGSTLNITPKWQVGLNGYYNITTGELGSISTYLTREMHCWQMAINISKVGTSSYFNISISPKSGILRDLKVNRTRYFYDF